MTFKKHVAPLAVLLPFAVAAVAAAQSAPQPPPAVTVPSVSLILPNYNSVPIGEVAGLEGGAFVARANDPSSGYYNPAGLARAEQTSVSGTAGVYQFGSVSPDGLTNTQGSMQQIPSTFAVLVNNLLGRPKWSGGFSVTRAAAWSQAVDTELVVSSGGIADRFRFSTEADYDAWLASAGVGYALSDRLRVGGTLDGQYTSISRRQSLTDQQISGSGLSAVSVAALGSVAATHMRGTLGAQYRATPSIHVGATVRTPGLGLTASSDASLEGIVSAGNTTAAFGFFDPDASTEYRLPFEFKAGVAWIGSRAQAEFDILTYSGTGEYRAVASTEPVSVAVDNGQGAPPIITKYPYQGALLDSRSVVDVAIGGRYQLMTGRSWTLHAGFATDSSPVGENDTGFTKVDLQHFTIGLSGRTKIFLGSIGLQYSTGRSDPVVLGTRPDGTTVETRFKVSTFGLVYSMALLF